MAMLERIRQFFSLKDPTADWRRDAQLTLSADLGRPTLNGIELGRPLAELSGLGQAEVRDPDSPIELGYPSLGLIVESIDDATFTGFQLIHIAPDRPQFAPFAGDCHCGETRLPLAEMTEARWNEALGPCYWRDEDEEEVLLFYEFPYHELQIELTRGGLLKCIVVTGSPLMADAEQRQAYGVTKAWPPEIGKHCP